MKIFAIGKPKKASLSLSLNAIVILILAVAMLGLGLAFIRGIFKNVTGKVDEAVSIADLTNPPTRDRPITMTPPRVELRSNEKFNIKVAFLNTLDDGKEFKLTILPSGTDATNHPEVCTVAAPCNIPLVFNEQSVTMAKDQINVWTIAITPNEDSLTPPGGTLQSSVTYLYTVKMEEIAPGTTSYTSDFIVVVKA